MAAKGVKSRLSADDFFLLLLYNAHVSNLSKKESEVSMRIWKLVSGILNIVLFFFVTLQSCAAGLSNALEENDEVSGSAGVIVAVMLLAGGIVSIVTRNSKGKGGNIALIVLFGLGAFFGFVLAGSYADLRIWAAWCLICLVMAVVSIVKGNNSANEQE